MINFLFIVFTLSTIVQALDPIKCEQFIDTLENKLGLYDATVAEAFECIESIPLTPEHKKTL